MFSYQLNGIFKVARVHSNYFLSVLNTDTSSMTYFNLAQVVFKWSLQDSDGHTVMRKTGKAMEVPMETNSKNQLRPNEAPTIWLF